MVFFISFKIRLMFYAAVSYVMVKEIRVPIENLFTFGNLNYTFFIVGRSS